MFDERSEKLERIDTGDIRRKNTTVFAGYSLVNRYAATFAL
jgi:hypothetical protein